VRLDDIEKQRGVMHKKGNYRNLIWRTPSPPNVKLVR
jgi:hypothetical protein